MYADIGPSSLKLQFIHAIQDVDDYRVEYAHLDKDKLEESQRVISLEHKTNGTKKTLYYHHTSLYVYACVLECVTPVVVVHVYLHYVVKL